MGAAELQEAILSWVGMSTQTRASLASGYRDRMEKHNEEIKEESEAGTVLSARAQKVRASRERLEEHNEAEKEKGEVPVSARQLKTAASRARMEQWKEDNEKLENVEPSARVLKVRAARERMELLNPKDEEEEEDQPRHTLKSSLPLLSTKTAEYVASLRPDNSKPVKPSIHASNDPTSTSASTTEPTSNRLEQLRAQQKALQASGGSAEAIAAIEAEKASIKSKKKGWFF